MTACADNTVRWQCVVRLDVCSVLVRHMLNVYGHYMRTLWRMLLHTNVVLSSCAAVATDQHGTVTEGGCLRVNKKGAGGLAGGLKSVVLQPELML